MNAIEISPAMGDVWRGGPNNCFSDCTAKKLLGRTRRQDPWTVTYVKILIRIFDDGSGQERDRIK